MLMATHLGHTPLVLVVVRWMVVNSSGEGGGGRCLFDLLKFACIAERDKMQPRDQRMSPRLFGLFPLTSRLSL